MKIRFVSKWLNSYLAIKAKSFQDKTQNNISISSLIKSPMMPIVDTKELFVDSITKPKNDILKTNESLVRPETTYLCSDCDAEVHLFKSNQAMFFGPRICAKELVCSQCQRDCK